MCVGCEYFQKCPVGFKKIEFEFDGFNLCCETVQKFYDLFVEVKEVRNEWKKEKEEKYPLYSYFG